MTCLASNVASPVRAQTDEVAAAARCLPTPERRPRIPEPSINQETALPTGKLFYSVPEACAVLGIGRSFLYELLARDELPSVVLGRRRLIHVAALERWAAEQAGSAAPDVPAREPVGSARRVVR